MQLDLPTLCDANENESHDTLGLLCSCSAGRQPKAVANNQRTASADAPGPADYDTAMASSTLAHNVAWAAFSSRVSRGFAPPTDGAAPGQYDNPLQLAREVAKSSRLPHSVFKSDSRRLDSGATLTPGPGAYNAEDAEVALRYDWVAKAHTSAAFQAGSLDRFGRVPGKAALVDAELGPGAYKLESLAESLGKKAGSTNVFRSTTARADSGLPAPDVPGPAFYHPSSPDRRSHLLNANKKWL